MSRHETWCRIVLVVVGVLALTGLLRHSPVVVTFGVVAATVAASARIGWTMLQRDGEHATTGWKAWSQVWPPATLGFVGVLVLHGLHVLLGSAAIPIGVGAAIAALGAFIVLRRLARASAEDAAPPPASNPPTSAQAPEKRVPQRTGPYDAPPSPALPTPILCWEWRRSYLAVTRASKPDELTRIVALRAAYLDELERRDPTGFRRWLESGARAASDPGRYLASG